MVKIMADKEQLSALMDGESVDQALISELEHDAEGLKSWQNYHLIGDVMRGEAPERTDWDIANSVALALENEPAHSPVHVSEQVVTPAVESQPTPDVARVSMPGWLNQFGQVAMAACVSLVVILGVQQYNGENGAQSQSELPVLQTIPVIGSAEPVSLARESATPSSNEAQLMEQRKRVNALLQDYNMQLRFNSAEMEEAVHPTKSDIE
ncbi:Sigma-E factor negative regulatory protein [Vibrio nigripulchritudo SOn1]|uniref:Anti-sigma-E factor RseA n=1 Tax=Vibrio nigripulchritudo SOn1 TaxID=1238450 RepID=A0AAV2VWS9_9VIBR|nr:RseA family anti-sigma factor [Vibrio nigripulchritudo]CCO49206.1 Sigma-E factor negative regulatory protein [Vibrio nigripulchritudo SOn1]